ncbi:MAG: coiled coil domain-containing protein [Thiobacillaceae bacterium]
MSKRDAYVQKMQAKLDEWNSEIDKLAAKADSAQADAKLKYQEQVEKLKVQRDAARHKLDELAHASESAWEDLRTGVDLAWESISMAVKDAIARFK